MAKKKKIEEEDEASGGVSLDDAFADDEDVVYAESKPKKKKIEKDDDDEEEEKTEDTPISAGNVKIKSTKPIEQIKKGDKIKVDGKDLEVDAIVILMDHKVTKEMAIECFDPKTDKDYQVRYFTGRLDVSDPELYELVNDFMYLKKPLNKLEW